MTSLDKKVILINEKEKEGRNDMSVGEYMKKWITALLIVIMIVVVIGGCTLLIVPQKKPVKKKEVVTLRLTGSEIDYSGVQGGWFADLLLERFGCRLDVRPVQEYDDPMKEADLIYWGGIAEPDYVKKSSDLTNVKKGGNVSLAVNAHSKHKELANRFMDYLNSPKGMMELLYGPEKDCWYYENGKAYFTENGYSYHENSLLIYPAKKAKQDTFAMGSPRFAFLPYEVDMLDPNTGEAYNILNQTPRRPSTKDEMDQPKNDLDICAGVKKIQVSYVGMDMDELNMRNLDSTQMNAVKKYFDSLVLEKKTFQKGKSPKDIQKQFIRYTMQGGKYKEVVYYPYAESAISVSLDGKWYNVSLNKMTVEPINDPADAFEIGSQNIGTHFYIYGKDYDIAKQNADVTYIEEGISAGRYVVVKCHMKKEECGEYFIYDRIKRTFIYEFAANCFSWNKNDITHGYYADRNTIYSYDGKVFQKTDCKKDERIVYLEQKGSRKLKCSIASWSTGEIRECTFKLK